MKPPDELGKQNLKFQTFKSECKRRNKDDREKQQQTHQERSKRYRGQHVGENCSTLLNSCLVLQFE